MEKPLIVVTNDDGIEARGLWAAAEALLPLGELLVSAPDRQWSGGGRSMPPDVSGCITPLERTVAGQPVRAYAVDASPALVVGHAVLEIAARRPSLVVSGINFGANLGTEVTISGTIGAALEAGAFGIPALAVSLEMDPRYHLTGDENADYTAAMAFTQQLTRYLLNYGLPHDVDALSLNIPADATPHTPWRLTRQARSRYYLPLAPDRQAGQGRPGYRALEHLRHLGHDTDIWALKQDRVVTITPLSLDLTSRVDLAVNACLCADLGACLQSSTISIPTPAAPLRRPKRQLHLMAELPWVGLGSWEED
ncbi:MAG: 5'/3'-nucleotidase SurE [Anaerolineae bacterium]